MDNFCPLLQSFVKKSCLMPLDVVVFLWGLLGFLGLTLVFWFSGDFFFVLVEVWWGSEGFCKFIVTCSPEFARSSTGAATGRDCHKKKGETKS